MRLIRELQNVEKTQEFVRMCRPEMNELQEMDNKHGSLVAKFKSAQKYERYDQAAKLAYGLNKLLPPKRAIERKYWLKRKGGE